MIYTITFNPALDYVVKVDDFKNGLVNRTIKEDIYAGGKGINVSSVLKNIGFESVALGFIAGFTGEEIQRRVNEYGVKTDFIKLSNGMSRINLKLKSNEETEINGIGPKIQKNELEELFCKFKKLQKGDIMVLAGSIPSSVPKNIYETIMGNLDNKGVNFIVDATGELLLNVLKYKPFLIKPNHHELAELFNVQINSDEDIIFYGKKLIDMGAKNVLISMAGDGAIFITESGKVYKSKAPKGTVLNSVGAGDSMVAGFIAGYLESLDMEKAFKMGVATGSASAFSEGLATKDEIYNLLKRIQ